MDIIFVAEIPAPGRASPGETQLRKSFQDAFVKLHYPAPSPGVSGDKENPSKSAVKSFAHPLLKDANARWVLPQDVDDMVRKYPEALFVCEKFKGASFGTLVEKECWVRGAESLQCLPSRLSLDAYVPVYSGIMNTMVISFSGISTPDQMRLHEMIVVMGGRVSRHLRTSSTHLVAEQVGTAKYFMALEAKMSVVQSSWVEAMWSEMQQGDYYRRRKFVEILQQKHALPYLQGLAVHIAQDVVASMPADHFQACRDLIVNSGAGGTFVEAADKSGPVTHVICTSQPDDTENFPQRCRFVKLDWLLDSAKERKCLNWTKYLVAPSDVTARTLTDAGAPGTSLSHSALERNISGQGEAEAPVLGLHLFSPEPKQRASVKRTYSDCALATSTPKKPARAFSAAKFDLSPIKECERTDRPAGDGEEEGSLSKPLQPVDGAHAELRPVLAARVPHILRRSFSESCAGPSLPRSPRPSSTANLARRILALQPATTSTNSSGDADKTTAGSPREEPTRPQRLTLPAGRGLARKMLDECRKTEPKAPEVIWDEKGPSSSLRRSSSSKGLVNGCGGLGKASPTEIQKPDASQFVFMYSRPRNSDADGELADFLSKGIDTLGARQLRGSAYDGQVTHLLCSRPYVTEKFMACCSSGKWILHTQYIRDSLKVGYLLQEEDYEWGNVRAGRLMAELSDTELRWATACHYWRLRVLRTGRPAFHAWRVNVAGISSRRSSYQRCLEAAGAVILADDAPVDEEPPSHALHDHTEPAAVSHFEGRFPRVARHKEYVEEYLLDEAHPGCGRANQRRRSHLPPSAAH